jgi:hypothetical protein
MRIQGNRKESSLALSATREEWSIHCSMGLKFVVGLSSVVCKLTILSAIVLSLNTITKRVLTCQELQQRFMCDVPQYYE